MPPCLPLWILAISQRYPISNWMTQNVFPKIFNNNGIHSFFQITQSNRILWKRSRAQCLSVARWVKEAPMPLAKGTKTDNTSRHWIWRLRCGQEPVLILFSPLPTLFCSMPIPRPFPSPLLSLLPTCLSLMGLTVFYSGVIVPLGNISASCLRSSAPTSLHDSLPLRTPFIAQSRVSSHSPFCFRPKQ